MADFSLGSGFEQFQRDMEQNMGDFTKMKERIDEAVGKGEAADGRIYAEFTAKGGLTRLDIDPRALRLPSFELTEEIKAAVNAASADFQTKVREASETMFKMSNDPDKPIDPSAALASLDKIANGFAGQMKDLARELGLQQQRAKEAMDNYKGPNHPGNYQP
ncbi:YbaB/EbfC family nucleoid-associated protein [Actinomadura rudentiformis]|uniref:YbaB/EbfC family nucleoid-associated protein n=1 Tax=Actinomadura rudentiformis TaxID=359158 RepID=A0A6H9YNS5_9ACTN|nr:YbaB/EbfC family nucleoid-associated protein [Actinomadura rudentiformis]KAB2347825.1 YbaB/EbfC family nucleoid-associated protein [Actinomadura rudentiformis]